MYLRRKLNSASQLLKNSKASNREALLEAYVHHLIMLKDSDFPIELQSDFRELVQAVTLPKGVEPIAGHSGSSHTISDLSEQEISRLISVIHKINEALDPPGSK